MQQCFFSNAAVVSACNVACNLIFTTHTSDFYSSNKSSAALRDNEGILFESSTNRSNIDTWSEYLVRRQRDKQHVGYSFKFQ